MAGKRSATSDLNHENWDQDDEDQEDPGKFIQASTEELKKRVIKKAKRRGITPKTDGPSLFASFGGFGGGASLAAPSSSAGAFDFLNKPTEQSSGSEAASFGTSPNGGSAFGAGSEMSAPPKATFSFGSGLAKPAPLSDNGVSLFGGSVSSEPTKATFSFAPVDKTPKETKPENPPVKEKSGFDFSGIPKMPVAGKKWECSGCCVSNNDDQDKCPCCETPREGAKPSSEKTTKPSDGVSGGFNFSGLTQKPAGGKKWNCGECFASNDDAIDACACCEHPKPGAAPKPKEPAAGGFKFGSSGGFSFGTADPSAATPPAEGSGFNLKSSETTKAMSGFKFGSEKKEVEKVEESKKIETLKKKETSEKYGKEFLANLNALNKQFSEWISQHIEKDPYVILTPCLDDYAKHLTELKSKFGDMTTEKPAGEPSVEKPQEKSVEAENPALLGAVFGNGAKTPPKPVTFGSGSSGFGFSFGKKDTGDANAKIVDTDEKIGSSFGAKSDAPGFSFGSKPKSSAAAPASTFSFGSSAKETNTTTSGFSFGTSAAAPAPGGASKGFSFGSSSAAPSFGSGSMFGAAAASAMAKKDDDSKQGEEETEEDQPPKVEVKQVQEDDAIHSVRCKLFYKTGKEFVEKGLGMLHLKKVDDKAQMVVRAETNLGNILLNIVLNASMNFNKRANNVQFSCVPNPPIKGLDEGQPQIMLIKVKNADSASILDDEIKKLI